MPWAIGTVLVAAAWGVAAITPAESAYESPFPLVVEIGEQGVGRNIAVTATDVHRASRVTAGEWSADGNWVVVDLDAAAVVSEFASSLSLATLEADGRTFRASERPDSLLSAGLSVGVPRSGGLAFELPADITDGSAILRLALDTDTRLDSVVVVELDLGEIPLEDAVELPPTEWSTP
jgi:hypothetical protein